MNKLLFEMAAKYGIPYFANYVNSDMDPSQIRAMCPLTPETEVLVKSPKCVMPQPIEQLYKQQSRGNTESMYQVWTGSEWIDAVVTKQDPTDIIEITLSNGVTVREGINHLQPVVTTIGLETLRAEELQVGMDLPFNTNPVKVDEHDNLISLNSKPNYRIEKIVRIKNTTIPLYCVAIDSTDHLFMLASGLITHNCRLQLDLREIVKKQGGGYFGSGSHTGSVGVCTLNFPRLAYLSTDEKDFYRRLDNLLDIAARSLDIKRKVVTSLMERGLYPYTKRYIGNFDTYFSTIATVGMNEMCLNAKWIKKNILSKEGHEFTKQVLQHIIDRLPIYQEKYNALFNLESAPAESTSYRLAKHDKEKYPDIITAGTTQVPYYTNSSNLPVNCTDDIFEALDHQDDLQTIYTSGTVFHIFLGERLDSWKSAMALIKKVTDNYHLPNITLSPTYSICPEHGYIPGEHYTCPLCV